MFAKAAIASLLLVSLSLSKRYDVELGTSANVSCDRAVAGGNGTNAILPKGARRIESHFFVVANATLNDGGWYYCSSKNRSGIYRTFEVVVGTQPRIDIPTGKVSADVVTEGSIYRIKCPATGVPAPSFRWYHRSSNCSGNWRPVFISNRDLPTRYVLESSGNLEIFDFSRGDDGCYRCLVANAFGNDSRDFELTMLPLRRQLPAIFPAQATVRWRYATDGVLTCNATGLWILAWDETNHSSIRANASSSFLGSAVRLVFRRVGPSVVGRYTCRFRRVGDFIEKTKSIRVEVIGLPGSPPIRAAERPVRRQLTYDDADARRDVVFERQRGIRLSCRFHSNGSLPANVSWYENDGGGVVVEIASSHRRLGGIVAFQNATSSNEVALYLLERGLRSTSGGGGGETTRRYTCVASSFYYSETRLLLDVNLTYRYNDTVSSSAFPSSFSAAAAGGGGESNLRLVIGLSVVSAFLVLVFLLVLCWKASKKNLPVASFLGRFALTSNDNEYTREQDDGATSVAEIASNCVENLAYVSSNVDAAAAAAAASTSSSSSGDFWEIKRGNLVVRKDIGHGYFGVVYKGLARGVDGTDEWTTVAIKRTRDDENDRKAHSDLATEANLMKLVGVHENVIRLLGLCTKNGPLLIVMEYAEFGNLRDYLRGKRLDDATSSIYSLSDRAALTKEQLLHYALQIARGMKHLILKECIHRDLAARNVLVCAGDTLKISDFGLAKDMHYMEYYRTLSTNPLPVKWSAPEVMFYQTYTQFSDVWSYGIVLWEIATLGGTPYPSVDVNVLYRLLTEDNYRMEKPRHCPSDIYDLMHRCWYQCPSARPSFVNLVRELSAMIDAVDAYGSCSDGGDDDSW